eukprot:tig00021319_g20258.t1
MISFKDLVGVHKKVVRCLEFAPGGKRLATGSADGTIRLWALDHSKEITLTAHDGSVDALRWNPANGDMFASVSGIDKNLKLFDARAGKSSSTLPMQTDLLNLGWSSDGALIAVGNRDDVVTILDARKLKPVKVIKAENEVNEIKWNRKGDLFFMTKGTYIDVYKNQSWEKPVSSLQGHTGPVYCLDFSHDGRYLASGGADALVCIWDLTEVICLRTYGRPENQIRSVSFSRDGQFLAAAVEDVGVDVVAVESMNVLHQYRTSADAVAWSPADPILAIASSERDKYNNDGVVKLLKVA